MQGTIAWRTCLLKSQVFGHFLRNLASNLSKTLPETGDSCFESFNDIVVSRKILVLAVLTNFWSKKIACGDKIVLSTDFCDFLPIY